MSLLQIELERDSHPVDVIEQVAAFNEWAFERSGLDEIAIGVEGTWANYNVTFSWMEDFEALHLGCAFDMKVKDSRMAETIRLLSLINEQMLFGHFDIWPKDGSVMFRHAMPLNGGAEANDRQIECLLNAALDACERHYQAFQFVVWAGKPAQEALESVLFDTVGQA